MDASIAVALHQWASAQAWLAGLVVLVAQYGIFALPIALVAVWFRARADGDRLRAAIIAGCLAAVLAAAIGLVLERVLHRPRPFVELGFAPLVPHVDDSSFPSDHTLVGMALVGPLLWGATKPWLISLPAWALVIGCARVAAGLHYPTDIVGSAVLALGVDALAWSALVPRLRPVLVRLSLLRSDGRLPGNPP